MKQKPDVKRIAAAVLAVILVAALVLSLVGGAFVYLS